MAFAFEMAYVGPYALTLAKAHAGDTQTFHFKIPATNEELAGSAAFMLSGEIRRQWSSSREEGVLSRAGELLSGNRGGNQPQPLCLNESMTLTALSDCSYISAGVVGIEEKVVVTRVAVKAKEQLSLARYSLIMVPAGVAVSINEAQAVDGPRLIYARTGDVLVEPKNNCHLGVLSLPG